MSLPSEWPDPPVGTRVRHAHPPGEEGSPADGGRLAADAIRTIDPAAIVAKVKP